MSDAAAKTLSTGELQFRLALLFLLMAACLIGLSGAYWLTVLEPKLLAEGRSSAAALAQSQSQNLAEALLASIREGTPQKLSDAMDEVLILIDPNTGKPFVYGLEIKANADSVAQADRYNLQRGDVHCDNCFTSQVLLYSRLSHELLGAAVFHSSSIAFQRMREEVRFKLLGGSGVALLILLLVWRAVTALFLRVKAGEEAAAAATRAKTEFLATMSHEIRTPMNAILGMTHLLERSELTLNQRDQVHTIAASGDALLVILNDILDLSRIEAGKLTLEYKAFDLRRLLDDVINLMSARADEKGIALRVEYDPALPPVLHGDSARLRQVLLNLVGNAVKFTHKGNVTLRARRRRDVGDDDSLVPLELAVIDTGIGIEADKRATLFQPFSQADTGIARRYGGSGLGLAICKRLIEAMGGSIGVDSTPGAGSTFYAQLYLEQADTLDMGLTAETSAANNLRPLHILVADDQEINRRVVRALLTQEGHSVKEVASGQEALEAVQHEQFDVVLMDLQMPQLDGIEATRHIRSLPNADRAATPIIALTANILKEEREHCLQAGMDGFIVKPFTPDGLNEELSRVMRGR